MKMELEGDGSFREALFRIFSFKYFSRILFSFKEVSNSLKKGSSINYT